MLNISIAIILDFLIGDPYDFPHPVKQMGKIIAFEEKLARRWVTDHGLKLAGLIIVIVNISLGFLVPLILLNAIQAYRVVYNIANIYLIYTCVAARSLHYEANKVKDALTISLAKGRKRLSYIVGRDTKRLSEEEVIQATVETVAENTSDGVIGPLLFIMVLGVPGGMAYKFVNTMDSMLGYMDDRYKNLGYFPAKVDDLFNWIPARITALLMIIASIGRFNIKNGLKMMKRDCRNHKSPNAGFPESAVAGLLEIQLGGGGYYHGLYIDKPTIGDGVDPMTESKIVNTVEIMYRTELLLLLIYIVCKII